MERSERKVTILLSLTVLACIATIIYFQPPLLSHWIIELENDTYDGEVRKYHRPIAKDSSIVIVDIDDRSISEEGRWPWSREKMGQIAVELEKLGAAVIAYDMVFSEAEENPVDQIANKVNNETLKEELNRIRPSFDRDAMFARELEQGAYSLGFAFATNGQKEGMLPEPLFTLSDSEAEKTLIPSMNGFIGNLPVLQQAVKSGGFINTTIDADGILRFSPLLLRDDKVVYPSLALEAAKLFLKESFQGIITTEVREHETIQGIRLGKITIPTDPWGRILIPFRGKPYSFPYIPATDLLHGKVDPESVRDKLIFVGTSATASWDLLATAISPVFPGVEVQASIASGIIDGYLPHKPQWGRGTAILGVVLLGLIVIFSFPYMGHLAAFCFTLCMIAGLKALNYWAWAYHGLVLSFFLPMPTIAILFVLDMICVYIADRKHKKEMAQIKEMEAHAEALEAYLAQDWKRAETLFKSLQELFPHNRSLYHTYLEKIRSTHRNLSQ